MNSQTLKLPDSQTAPPLLSPDDVRQFIGAECVQTVHRLVAAGQLPRPVINKPKFKRWRQEDIDAHLARAARG